ncbi:HAD-IC family P-type ATPase, partial [Candidatus Gracilibacteria bacterium]|nr:HAD-IC family P-type ATPase [Candidatus Gracilibacteria bacterium]
LASLEKQSEHPLATAIVEKSQEENIPLLPVTDFIMREGKGVEGVINGEKWFAGNITLMQEEGIQIDTKKILTLTKEGKTPIFLAKKGAPASEVSIFGIADTIKDNAKDIVSGLRSLGIKTVMLTGDNQQTAEYIASLVGIDDVRAQVLPHEKEAVIRTFQASGEKVAMCGDGVNDAPALARADVGIAMGTGTDVAIETADITLLAGDISKILLAIKLSKRTMRTIKQNLFWAFIYNIVGIPLAAGLFYPFLLNPIFAGLAMAASSVSVVTNSLRLKAFK